MCPREMIEEISLGIEHPPTVASRYGFDPTDYALLEQQDWFLRSVNERREELKRSGWTFRAKMGMMAEELLVDAWRTAKLSDSASVKLEVAKYLTKVADLEPKEKAQVQQGTGFSINIQINHANPAKAATIIDATPTFDSVLSALDGLPPIPSHLSLIPYEELTVPYEEPAYGS